MKTKNLEFILQVATNIIIYYFYYHYHYHHVGRIAQCDNTLICKLKDACLMPAYLSDCYCALGKGI